MTKYKDNLEDATLKLAKDNLAAVEHLEGDLQVYQETVHPLYAEQQEKISGLLETVEAKQGLYSRENAIKVLKQAANEKYKQGRKAQQNFTKNAGGKDDFLKEFIQSRKEYYQLQAYTDVVVQAPDATQ